MRSTSAMYSNNLDEGLSELQYLVPCGLIVNDGRVATAVKVMYVCNLKEQTHGSN
jgi:hypothetical protein